MSAFDDYLKAPAAAGATQTFDGYMNGGAAAAVPPALRAPTLAQQPAPGVSPAQASANADDLAAGGASPDTLEQLGQIGGAAAHGIGSMFSNAANLVEKGIASGLSAIPGVQITALARAAQQTANSDVMQQAQADQDFQQNASPGQKASAFIAPMMLPIGAAGNAVRAGVQSLPMMGGMAGRVASSVLGNATTGALASAGSPIDPNGSSYWSQVGRNTRLGAGLGVGLGTVLPAAVSAGRAIGGGIWDALRPIISPQAYVGQGLANAVGDDAGAVAGNIRSAPQYVPGSMPTTAQAGQNPTLVATEKAAANGVPGFKVAQTVREDLNNQARWDSLNAIARAPADLDAAVAAREAAAGPAYQAARAQTYTVDPDLTSLMERPAMQDALARGLTIARNEGNQGLVPAVQPRPAQFANVPTGATGFNGQPLFQQVITQPARPGQPAQVSGDVLHYLKLGMDDLQNSARENTRLGPQERRAINTAQNDYLGWLDNASPDYAQGRQAYAANSPQVNTLQAGQQMVDRLGGLGRSMNTSGVPQMTAPGYATALSQALRAQEFGIDPSAQQTLENIGRDLQRSTVSNSMRSPGSDTAYNLSAQGWLGRQLYGPTFGGAGNLAKGAAAVGAAALGHPMVGLGILGGANRLGTFVGGRLNNQLSNFLLDPNALLPYLDARATAATVNGANQPIGGLLQRNVLPAVINGVTRGGLMYSQ